MMVYDQTTFFIKCLIFFDYFDVQKTWEHIAKLGRKRKFTEDSYVGGTRPEAYFNKELRIDPPPNQSEFLTYMSDVWKP